MLGRSDDDGLVRAGILARVDAPDDEDLLHAHREELIDRFAAWVQAHATRADPADADVALDWKISYADGALTTWSVADLAEFALEWCPRKLSMPAQHVPGFLDSLGEFFLFLAGQGLLRGAGPEQLRSWCVRRAPDVERAMSDPRNFGMAKALFSGVGGLDDPPEDQAGVESMMQRLQAMSPDEIDAALGAGLDDGRPDDLGLPPVPRPTAEEVAASASAAPIVVQMARLVMYCRAPGRTLTATGNLKVADAHALAVELAAPRNAGPRDTKARSIEDFPELEWLLRVALRARVVRRQRGKLVAVAAWSKLDPPAMVERLADAALLEGLDGSYGIGSGDLEEALDEETFSVAVALLGTRAAGEIDIEGLGGAIAEALGGPYALGWGRDDRIDVTHRILDRLERSGVAVQRGVDRSRDPYGLPSAVGGTAEVTDVGVGVLVRWVEMTGAVVPDLPDPSSGTAQEMLRLVGRVHVGQFHELLAAWADAQDEHAVDEMVGALADPDRPPSLMYSTLEELQPALGDDRAHAVVRGLLGGRWDGLAVMWLSDRGDEALADAEPLRALHGMVDLFAAALDDGGPEELNAQLPAGGSEGPLEDMWRLEHPRVREVLEVVGRHHSDKTVAKTARRSLAKLRSRG